VGRRKILLGRIINQKNLKERRMVMEIGVEDGEIIAISKGLNIRDYNLEVALARLQR
jgi:hypothetical protein